MMHGTASGYRNHACRCADCREAHRLTVHAYRRQRGTKPSAGQQPLKHGSKSAYERYGCRCAICRNEAAQRRAVREQP